jgi:predicted RNase H-like HicB family nuclease
MEVIAMKRYALVIEKTSTGYSAYSPEPPGCAAAGDTEEETRWNFQGALIAHFELMRELGQPIPQWARETRASSERTHRY